MEKFFTRSAVISVAVYYVRPLSITGWYISNQNSYRWVKIIFYDNNTLIYVLYKTKNILSNNGKLILFLISGQSLLTYGLLFIVYFPLFCCHLKQVGQQQQIPTSTALARAMRERGMRYFIIAVMDVEGNYLLHKAFQYTTFTSIQVKIGLEKGIYFT